jgi:hypothetical protein
LARLKERDHGGGRERKGERENPTAAKNWAVKKNGKNGVGPAVCINNFVDSLYAALAVTRSFTRVFF